MWHPKTLGYRVRFIRNLLQYPEQVGSTMIKVLLICLIALCPTIAMADSDDKIVVAHRGASGYLPEHTLAAKAMAYAMGADYIEQDVVMSKDNQLLVLHDHYLDRVSDVMTVFPERFRDINGKKRWFAIDFTLAEIRQLRISEGFAVSPSKDDSSGELKANYSQRFPLFKSRFQVSTLAEEIELIQGLNKSTGRNVGIYPEIKSPWFHRHEGKDISQAVLVTLKKYGYTNKNDKIYLQSFDPIELQRIRKTLMPALNMDLKLVQLIAMTDWNETMVYGFDGPKPYDYGWMFEAEGMKTISAYADGVGPWMSMIVNPDSTREKLKVSALVERAHDAGLKVHPYTFRADPEALPDYVVNFDDLLELFLYQLNVDGVFSDFPDKAVDFVRAKRAL